MISFEDIRPQLKKFVQEGCETADYIMRVSKTPKEGIYAYEELQPLTRCKDCKHWWIDTCQLFPTVDEPDGFCAWGERRDA